MTIERKHHMKIKAEVNSTRAHYVQKFWNLTLELNTFNKDEYHKIVMSELYEYQLKIVNYSRKGYDGRDNLDYSAQWSFAGAFLYSLTVITTIGKCVVNDFFHLSIFHNSCTKSFMNLIKHFIFFV